MIETQLHHASIRMMRNSDTFTNNIVLSNLKRKGFINSAHVSTVTISNDTSALIKLRADGAIISFTITRDNRLELEKEIDRIYRSTVKYAEKYFMLNEIREKALKNYSVEVIKDSVSKADCRLTTMKLVYPRYIHAEFMTHRVFSRNASSSRAIPIQKMVEKVKANPAIPLVWGSNKAGMQAGEDLSDEKVIKAYNKWLSTLDFAIEQAESLYGIGLHKQHVNRILEPFMLIEVLVTATEWDNFFELRCHEDAQPEIKHLAELMRGALNESKPVERIVHIPFVNDDIGEDESFKLSTARCARVSYTLRDGSIDKEKDIALHDALVVAEPLHASPAEHQAVAMRDDRFDRNFRGWSMYRNKLENGEW